MNQNPPVAVETYHQHSTSVPQFPRHSHTASASSISNPTSRSRASSTATHTSTAPRQNDQQQQHIRFRGSENTRSNVTSSSESSPQTSHHQSTPHQNEPPPSPRLQPTHPSTMSLNNSLNNSPSRIKVKDLTHIQSFASEEFLTRSRHPSRHSMNGRFEAAQQYEISAMPVTDIIEMVAGLLTKITTQNDRQHENMARHFPTTSDASAGLTHQANSILAFHGKNVPSITINSYLMRIHKYCPTTYEVFLSLLIYFDRMTEMINQGKVQSFSGDEPPRRSANRTTSSDSAATVKPESPTRMSASPTEAAAEKEEEEPVTKEPEEMGAGEKASMDLIQHFVVDSFNIHRLVMAGVTCSSKFFSDVFYTNSRYAKVGGLPLIELNHLELQFLLLNDFRLSISLEDLESYGTRLVDFYMEEVVIQQQQQKAMSSPTSPTIGGDEGIYMGMG